MSDIVISKNDEVDIVVKSDDSGIVMELSEFFTFTCQVISLYPPIEIKCGMER